MSLPATREDIKILLEKGHRLKILNMLPNKHLTETRSSMKDYRRDTPIG